MLTSSSLLFMATLGVAAVSVCGWLWGAAWWAALRRTRIRSQPFPAAWRQVLRERMPYFKQLPPDLQWQVKKQVQVLLAEVPFIGCAGLLVSNEMRVLIAAQAALLLLNRRAGSFRRLRQVLVYPGAFVVERSTTDGHGITQNDRRVLAGESWQQGQVILSWQDVLDGAATPDDGHNVVIHEFAHQLDQETGPANGAPFLLGRKARQSWAHTLAAEYAALRQRVALAEPGLISDYGATDPAEFFAVVSELFFERPAELAQSHPALFEQLQHCYRTNPLSW